MSEYVHVTSPDPLLAMQPGYLAGAVSSILFLELHGITAWSFHSWMKKKTCTSLTSSVDGEPSLTVHGIFSKQFNPPRVWHQDHVQCPPVGQW